MKINENEAVDGLFKKKHFSPITGDRTWDDSDERCVS